MNDRLGDGEMRRRGQKGGSNDKKARVGERGGCLGSAFIPPREDPLPGMWTAALLHTGWQQRPPCALAGKTSWEGRTHIFILLCAALSVALSSHPHSLRFLPLFMLLDLCLFPSPPSAFLLDLLKRIISHHREFCSYFVLFPSKSISATVLCVQRLD